MKMWKLKNPDKVKSYNDKRDKVKMRKDSYKRYWADPEKFRAKSREWGAVNKEKKNASIKKWQKENLEKAKFAVSRYKKANRIKYNLYQAKRNALTRGIACGNIDLEELISEKGMICGICGELIKGKNKISLDHIIPLSKGGTHSQDNLQLSHLICNIRKGSKL